MAKAKKSEGAEVRKAYDGPDLSHDGLIDHMEARIAEEHARASDSGESAAKVRTFLDQTGLNSKAHGWLKQILKLLPKKDGRDKAMDVIRSLEAGLPMLKDHVGGQNTPDFLEDQEKEAPKAEAPKADKKTLAKFTPKVVAKVEEAEIEVADQAEEPEPVDLADEADDFDRHLAEVAGN